MTPAMLSRARANAARQRMPQVEFRLGEIEHLPVADASVDVVISNCVVNLSPDKGQVFHEAARVLKPGGRMIVSDLVLERPLREDLRRRADLLVGCVAGAALESDDLTLARAAGFERLEVLERRRYAAGAAGDADAGEAFDAVRSITLRGWKPDSN
jgi:SAM-dependent methyltransferase